MSHWTATLMKWTSHWTHVWAPNASWLLKFWTRLWTGAIFSPTSWQTFTALASYCGRSPAEVCLEVQICLSLNISMKYNYIFHISVNICIYIFKYIYLYILICKHAVEHRWPISVFFYIYCTSKVIISLYFILTSYTSFERSKSCRFWFINI